MASSINNSLKDPSIQTTKKVKFEKPQEKWNLVLISNNQEMKIATDILAKWSLKKEAAFSLINLIDQGPPKKSTISKIKQTEQNVLPSKYDPTKLFLRSVFRTEKKSTKGVLKFPFWKTLEKYLNQGANINAQSQHRIEGERSLDTVLHRACELEVTDRVTKLLERGADPTITNAAGHVPGEMTTDSKIQKILKRYGELKSDNKPTNDLENDPIVKPLIASK